MSLERARLPLAETASLFLALLAKPTAAFLLPVAAVLVWVRLWRERPPVRHLLWLGVWAVGFLILAAAQIEVNRRSGTPDAALVVDGIARIRSMAVIALHYLWMSATSLGVSVFHEPELSIPWTSPSFLAAVPVLALLAARAVWSAFRRREEAVYWTWAAASFAPVSQIFPFLYPMADRYLYFIVPGLLGATLLALRDFFPSTRSGRAGLVLAASVCLVFAVRSHTRAEIWRSPVLILADAARNYPDGVSANLLRAKRAAQEGTPSARWRRCAPRRREASTASSSSTQTLPTNRSAAIRAFAHSCAISRAGGSSTTTGSRARHSWSSASAQSRIWRAASRGRPSSL
jgi:hypothetical protein